MKISSADTCGIQALLVWIKTRFPEVEILPEERYREADILFCDNFGDKALHFPGVKVLYTAENHFPDLNQYDYALTHERLENDRCHRFPYWQYVSLLLPPLRRLAFRERPLLTAEQLVAEKRDFCTFICRNAACRKRNRFVTKLNAVRKVNCAGPFMHNVDVQLSRDIMDKIRYVRKHLFCVAYENESHPGYQTEKILDAFLSRSIPIYWGNPQVCEEFNPAAFVHARDFRTDEALIRYLLELADDPQRMADMLNAPIFRDPEVLQKAEKELELFIGRIIDRGPGALQRTRTQRLLAVLNRYHGHGLFRTLRSFSRHLRGKQNY